MLRFRALIHGVRSSATPTSGPLLSMRFPISPNCWCEERKQHTLTSFSTLYPQGRRASVKALARRMSRLIRALRASQRIRMVSSVPAGRERQPGEQGRFGSDLCSLSARRTRNRNFARLRQGSARVGVEQCRGAADPKQRSLCA
jgi:hypothetical protein